MCHSALVRAGYHYLFAFFDDRPDAPDLAAGVALCCFFRMTFAYDSRFLVHMHGGMGEIVWVPLYEVLSKRGVRFAFFHNVSGLEVADGKVTRVDGTLEAKLRGDRFGYRPLIEHGGRLCWPEAPLEDQIESWPEKSSPGAATRSDHPSAPDAFALEIGRDFDLVILSLPVGVLPQVAAALGHATDRWAKFLSGTQTTATIAAQIWFDVGRSMLKTPATGSSTGYELPHSTWADMSFLLPFEDGFADGRKALNLSYLCGPSSGSTGTDADASTQDWDRRFGDQVFPGLTCAQRKAHTIDAVYRRNDKPADCYLASPAGSVDIRMRAEESGFSNLFLAGDWVRTGLDFGCVECAMTAGKHASMAIAGIGSTVLGEQESF